MFSFGHFASQLLIWSSSEILHLTRNLPPRVKVFKLLSLKFGKSGVALLPRRIAWQLGFLWIFFECFLIQYCSILWNKEILQRLPTKDCPNLPRHISIGAPPLIISNVITPNCIPDQSKLNHPRRGGAGHKALFSIPYFHPARTKNRGLVLVPSSGISLKGGQAAFLPCVSRSDQWQKWWVWLVKQVQIYLVRTALLLESFGSTRKDQNPCCSKKQTPMKLYPTSRLRAW